MRLPLIPILVIVLVNLLVDSYIYKVLKRRLKSLLLSRLQLWMSVALLVLIIVTILLPRRNCTNGMLLGIMWCLYTYFSFYIPKYIFVIVDLIAKVPRLFHRHRLKWLSSIGTVMAVLTFVAMWWGALVNRYDIDIKEVDVEIPNLPAQFDNYKIAQISDFHVGTYGNDTSYVADVVEQVNALNPDLVVFLSLIHI